MTVLVIESVEVGERHIEAHVRATDPALLRTSARPGLAERAVALLPGLKRHTCENDEGLDFVRELRDTETPHLLEHITTELAALAGSPRSLRAQTTWDFARDGRGVYRLCFAYDDDLVVLGALREAAAIVEWLFGYSKPVPDIDGIVARLEALRQRV